MLNSTLEKTKLEANDHEEDLDHNEILKLLLNSISYITELETKIQSLKNIISESKEFNRTLIQINTNNVENLSENILQNVEFLSELELSLVELTNVLKNAEESRLDFIQKFENIISLQETKDEFLQYYEDLSDENNELSDNEQDYISLGEINLEKIDTPENAKEEEKLESILDKLNLEQNDAHDSNEEDDSQSSFDELSELSIAGSPNEFIRKNLNQDENQLNLEQNDIHDSTNDDDSQSSFDELSELGSTPSEIIQKNLDEENESGWGYPNQACSLSLLKVKLRSPMEYKVTFSSPRRGIL